MNDNCETVRITKDIRIADVDDKPIHVGSVLRSLKDGESGVVVAIRKEGDIAPAIQSVGDVLIETGRGTTRVTNCYSEYKHVPHNEQTYQQRLKAWKVVPYEHEEDRDISKDEGLCIEGIMALLPDDLVDWEYGPWPDTIDDALGFLTGHLESLA